MTIPPENGGTRAWRNLETIQPIAGLPVTRTPSTVAVVTRPLGAKVTVTRAWPRRSVPGLHEAAFAAAVESAEVARARSNSGSMGAAPPSRASSVFHAGTARCAPVEGGAPGHAGAVRPSAG